MYIGAGRDVWSGLGVAGIPDPRVYPRVGSGRVAIFGTGRVRVRVSIIGYGYGYGSGSWNARPAHLYCLSVR